MIINRRILQCEHDLEYRGMTHVSGHAKLVNHSFKGYILMAIGIQGRLANLT